MTSYQICFFPAAISPVSASATLFKRSWFLCLDECSTICWSCQISRQAITDRWPLPVNWLAGLTACNWMSDLTAHALQFTVQNCLTTLFQQPHQPLRKQWIIIQFMSFMEHVLLVLRGKFVHEWHQSPSIDYTTSPSASPSFGGSEVGLGIYIHSSMNFALRFCLMTSGRLFENPSQWNLWSSPAKHCYVAAII